MIPDDKLAEIRSRIDLAALVGEHVALKRSGASFRGLCPFHGEKTPSFYVHPDRGFFHCFGCQASGDAIAFLMRIDGLSFPEAARQLAERAGIELAFADAAEDRAAKQARARRERLLGVVEEAAGFFVEMLKAHRFGPMAREELSRRAVSDETASRYRLGYAPAGWDELATHLGKRGISPADAEEVGLLVPRRQQPGHYDRFRHRLMFPISDPHGRIVAFSGRILPPLPNEERTGDPPAKYVNSPESPLYRKGELLFGLHEARVELRRRDAAVVCEGNFDVISVSQAGFANVVAPLGTAFTPAQAKLLRRYVSSVILLFDADAAGRKAVRAAQPLLAEAGLSARVAVLPPGEDPDSFLRAKGAEALQRVLDGAPSVIEHLIEVAAADAGADPHAKADAIAELGPVVASIDNPVEGRLYLERIARAFEISEVSAVREQLRRGLRAARRTQREPAAAQTPPQEHPRAVALDPLEADLVGALLDQPSLLASHDLEKIQELLTSDDLRTILRSAARLVGMRGVDASALLTEVGESAARDWLEKRLAVQNFDDEASARVAISRMLTVLTRRAYQRKRKELERELLRARRAGDEEQVVALSRRIGQLYLDTGRKMDGPEGA